MRVFAHQIDLSWESPSENREKLCSELNREAPDRGSLVVLPEMWSTGFSVGSTTHAQPPGGETETALQEIAKEYGVYLIAGIAVSDGGIGKNQAVLFMPDGSAHRDRYTKLFPFTPSGEADFYPRGSDVVIWEIGGLTIAPFICYDLRFPEPFAQAALAGADAFVVIANFPARRQSHWDILLRARAVECQAFAIGVNRIGSDPALEFSGGTAIIDPWGETLDAVQNDSPGIASFDLDPTVASDARASFPPLLDRREATERPQPLTNFSSLASA
ncbi:carbon-nitrogen family hydrolase [Verrucomicrobiales bacterium]|nr:carbon-nitrogen family hydrolase [Verrucomicrobiales bacterium]